MTEEKPMKPFLTDFITEKPIPSNQVECSDKRNAQVPKILTYVLFIISK